MNLWAVFSRSDPYYIRGPKSPKGDPPSLTHIYHHPIIRVPLPRVWLLKTNPIPTEWQEFTTKIFFFFAWHLTRSRSMFVFSVTTSGTKMRHPLRYSHIFFLSVAYSKTMSELYRARQCKWLPLVAKDMLGFRFFCHPLTGR